MNSLSQIIPPEIFKDSFYESIKRLARDESIKTILEIGSSSGDGSTRAFVEGIQRRPKQDCQLYCLELSRTRFEELKKRYQTIPFVNCYNAASVGLDGFTCVENIPVYKNKFPEEVLPNYPISEVIKWYQQDKEYLSKHIGCHDGINIIKKTHQIDYFDLVLIDGCEFTGIEELNRVYGAKWILLDDVRAFKNHYNYHRLRKDPDYQLIEENFALRNGYAIFKKNIVDLSQTKELPIHFFTLALNAQPFIKHHINTFKELDGPWHWHIIEGVAELNHDSSWSKVNGGQVPKDCHKNGLSIDGTTEYLDQIKANFSKNITIYRKDNGEFWDGKIEMVSAPMVNIQTECLLWQVDADELWTVEQVKRAKELFEKNPHKKAAYYWCHFFVGANLVTSNKHVYGNNPNLEWLRTWRYKPSMKWISHAPPFLGEPTGRNSYLNVANNAFSHRETEKAGLTFQHFAYFDEKQIAFKEKYYGYSGAVEGWKALQKQKHFPIKLNQFFPWADSSVECTLAKERGITPIIEVAKKSDLFVKSSINSLVVVDGVFFQDYNTGIASVWEEYFNYWKKTGFLNSVIFLDRGGFRPSIKGLKTLTIHRHSYKNWSEESTKLGDICQKLGAKAFISTYYTTAKEIPSSIVLHDLIPEGDPSHLKNPMWQEKYHAIYQASNIFCVSKTTEKLLKKYYPEINPKRIVIARNGVNKNNFYPASDHEIRAIRKKFHLERPYILSVSKTRDGYKNGRFLLQAFRNLPNREAYDLIFTGGVPLEEELQEMAKHLNIRILALTQNELRVAYSGALVTVFCSQAEGFGMPILEAMACGCPLITSNNSCFPEVAGDAAIMVDPYGSPMQLTEALCEIIKPRIRDTLISNGLVRTKLFDWKESSIKVQNTIVDKINRKNKLEVIKRISSKITKDNKDFSLDLEIGKLYLSLGENLQSIEHLLKTLKKTPQNLEVAMVLIDAFISCKDFKSAESLFRCFQNKIPHDRIELERFSQFIPMSSKKT